MDRPLRLLLNTTLTVGVAALLATRITRRSRAAVKAFPQQV